MLNLTPRQLAVAGCVVLFVALVATVAETAHGGRADVQTAVCQVFGPRCAEALEVAWCESRLRPWAISPGLDVGLFQINYGSHHWPGESFAAFRARMLHLGRNIAFAFQLSRQGTSWAHWVCKP
jgi:hypothetical protein